MVILSYIASIFSLFLAIFILYRDWRSFVHRLFAMGMVALGFEAGFESLILNSARPEQIMRWYYFKTVASSFLPGIWLTFSLSLGQENYKENIIKWRWGLLTIFLIPIILATFFSPTSLVNNEGFLKISSGLLPISWAGKLFHALFLISAVLILACLERTFRATSGAMRWQVKFIILGLAFIFAIRIYTSSQVLLYSILDIIQDRLNIFGLIGGNILITISLLRMSKINLSIYPSQTFLYNSLIILIIGIYLIIVGILAKLVHHLGYAQAFPLTFLFIFIAIILLAIFISSEKVRQKIKEFISRHLKRPHYDYREQWREFTKRTSSIIEINKLAQAVANMIAEALGISTASVWLFDENRGGLRLRGSTAYLPVESSFLKIPEKISPALIEELKNSSYFIDFQKPEKLLIEEFKKINMPFFQGKRIRYGIPLIINENILGLITVNEKVTKKDFSTEDFELLRTISDQVAGALLNLKLSEQLRNLQEAEAFRTISAFILHDLKNIASTLSLTMQNLPLYYDNPEFRQDAVRITEQSLAKINNLCSGLSALSQKIEIKKKETNLHELILNVFSSLNIAPSPAKVDNEAGNEAKAKVYEWKLNGNQISVIYSPQVMNNFFIDPEQIQKVLINLLLNAKDALKDKGEIRIDTRQNENQIEISVSDNGCGMSKEFIEKSLFRPFKTTKKKGMGIGLFQSKMIIEAHGGRLEVESEEKVGTKFRIFLPLAVK